ncbi:dipeptide/oligopeptide/nickel ABC transporter permease/ATP-binding protein [Cryptosporangium aurantiacum]|uniref:Peptide/nickel transport system permease protein n=1 Tax=Cryptosporangium aurantiacum TaxID=134849 RepID=A0A1M7TZ80_9ACTN|nr:dipeptide/oligopeptide/nickel ABC transporter permease/ATP-binding protein [Cryptosporangium aurantiacum]SHN76024.1 peptide/nickel transport system permease protein [Cryptosporangium aurantiacum]
MTHLSIPDPEVAAHTGSGPAGSRRVLTGVLRQPAAVVGLLFLLVVAGAAIFADWLAPYAPTEKDFDHPLSGPSSLHWLGTDDVGQDTLSRLIYGARIALLVAFGSVGIAMAIGVPFGLLLGYRGGWRDRLGSRLIDVSDALPGILLGFAVIAVLGRGLFNLMLAIGLIFCMGFARTTRAVALAERQKLYVDAAKVAGLRTPAILFRQVLPNLAGALIVQGSVFLASAIMVESALSFLGIGLESETPTWGAMLSNAAANTQQPFLALPPGLAIVFTVLAFNIVGVGIGDALTGTGRGLSRRGRKRRRPTPQAPRPAAPVVSESRAVLEFRDVTVAVEGRKRPTPLVQDVSLAIGRAEVVALLGESGSGKSMLARSALGLLPAGVELASGSVWFEGKRIDDLDHRGMRKIRGAGMAVVLQDPMSALSPVHTIGRQIGEPLRAHAGLTGKAARERAVELLDRVGVEDARRRLNDYPHQFSGGMAQRVAIAMALAAGPRLLIADEATSALDVTTQSQVLDLLLELRDDLDMAILLITHDLGVVAESCDRAAVMYAGELVEVNDVTSLFDKPRHPYTAALLAANPTSEADVVRLPTIPGRVPPAGEWPVGCHFAGRCAYARTECTERAVPLVHDVRCARADELTLEVTSR